MSDQDLLQGVSPEHSHIALKAGAASLAVVFILILAKGAAFVQSDAVSVLASLVDSIIDACVSIMTFFAIRYSLKPADADHRSGHGKVEGLAAVMQAGFIIGSAFFLLFEAMIRFLNPEPLGHIGLSVGVMLFSTVMAAVIVYIQNMSLRKAPSLAVEADRAHYLADIWVNIGVAIILVAMNFGFPPVIDPLFAVAVAMYMALTTHKIGKKGVDMLMDRELDPEIRERIIEKILSHEDVLGFHDLRTSRAGMRIFISFDIELDPSLTLYTAHEITRAVERDLFNDYPNAEIMIHVDPDGDTDDTRHAVPGLHH